MPDIRFLYDHDEFKAGQVLTGEEDLDLDKLWAEDIIAFVVPGEPEEAVETVPEAKPKAAKKAKKK